MAFKVEDGTGLPDSNSYTSVEFADAYFEARGAEVWLALDEAKKETLLIQATDYIDLRFGKFFCGKRLTEEQALQFPRNVVKAIPIGLQRATVEYAIRANDGPLMTDPKLSSTGYSLESKGVKVGPIEKRETFAKSMNPNQLLGVYPQADLYVQPFLCFDTGRVVRN
jgi:hypothetical protein